MGGFTDFSTAIEILAGGKTPMDWLRNYGDDLPRLLGGATTASGCAVGAGVRGWRDIDIAAAERVVTVLFVASRSS